MKEEKKYYYSVGKIRSIEGNTIVVNTIKYRICDKFGNYPILTSLSKWQERAITLTDEQMARFNSYHDEDTRRAYLTKVMLLS